MILPHDQIEMLPAASKREQLVDVQRQHDDMILRAHSPLRRPVEQADLDGLALFDCARSPTLI